MAPVGAFPALTAEQMGQVDRIMVDELGLDVLQLMELAGRAVAAFARERFLGGDPRGRRVLVLAGSGGNGGDGLVAARLLLGWGARVDVVLSHPPTTLRGPAAHQHRILAALGVPLSPPPGGGGTPTPPGRPDHPTPSRLRSPRPPKRGCPPTDPGGERSPRARPRR